MVGSELNCTPAKRGETSGGELSPALYYLIAGNRLGERN